MKQHLFMVLLGTRLKGRHTEQHDIFFGIAPAVGELVPDIKAFWPEAGTGLHVDAWRQVDYVDGYAITVIEKNAAIANELPAQKPVELFFINLGGYKENEFEEFHYKILVAAASLDEAKKKAKQTAFFKHYHAPGDNNYRAEAHIDDKFGIDIDDVYKVTDILPPALRDKFRLTLTAVSHAPHDAFHLGYYILKDL